MRKNILILSLLLASFASNGQGYTGLIARWPFNGNAQDVSGNNLNGVIHGATPTNGFGGLPGNSYYFNGVTDSITIPYNNLMNTVDFSICVLVKPEGFYSGNCQNTAILWRDFDYMTPDHYGLEIADNTSTNDCSMFTPNNEHFSASYYNNGTAVFNEDWVDTPIDTTRWYCAVYTYDGDSSSLYIDGELRKRIAYANAFVPGTGGISIGANSFNAFYPNWFTGKIDEIRLYNRALNLQEANIFCDSVKSCGAVTTQPAPDSVNTGNTTTFTVVTSMSSPTYQWQQDQGTGFINLSNAGPYSGVNTNTLTISNTSILLNNTYYRCLLSNGSCVDTSHSANLNVTATNGISQVITSDMVYVSPNPSHNQINILLPDNYSGTVELFNMSGQLMISKNISNSHLVSVDINALPIGIYIAKLQINGQAVVKKIIKE